MSMRCPSLSDYDAGSHLTYWAGYVAAAAHDLYDVPEVHDPTAAVPRLSVKETRAIASTAAEAARIRYDAYRAKLAETAETNGERYARIAAANRKKIADRRQEEKARTEAAIEHYNRIAAERQVALDRRLRWIEESGSWRERAPVILQTISEWGVGVTVLITKAIDVRWNDYPEAGTKNSLFSGEIWNVGERLATALIGRGHARLVNDK